METNRLFMGDMQYDDLEEMFEYMSDEHVMKYEREPLDREALQYSIGKYAGKRKFFVVILKKTGLLIGHVYIGYMNPKENNEYNLGYIFNSKFHNKGYCTEACRILLEYASNEINVRRIQATCNPENISSWKVME